MNMFCLGAGSFFIGFCVGNDRTIRQSVPRFDVPLPTVFPPPPPAQTLTLSKHPSPFEGAAYFMSKSACKPFPLTKCVPLAGLLGNKLLLCRYRYSHTMENLFSSVSIYSQLAWRSVRPLIQNARLKVALAPTTPLWSQIKLPAVSAHRRLRTSSRAFKRDSRKSEGQQRVNKTQAIRFSATRMMRLVKKRVIYVKYRSNVASFQHW